MKSNGNWDWWVAEDGETIVVGWLSDLSSEQDRPMFAMRDARDANLLRGILRDLELDLADAPEA